jgi:RNA polymerase sigma factor FliA
MGVEVAEHCRFLDQYSRAQVASLETRLEVDGRSGIEYGAVVEDSSVVDPRSRANLEDLRTQLVGANSHLEERERLVVTFCFYEGLTHKEIGKALDLTEGRISQVLRRALTKLREPLQGAPFASEGWRENVG